MSKEVEMFNFEGSDVRVITDEKGEPLFLAKDVCVILGYANVSQTVKDNCLEKGVSKRYTLTGGGNQELTYINEGNLYRLVIKSKKPEAERFENWVCDEVLVSIRKTGSYSVKPVDPMELLSDPKALLQLTVQYAKKQIELENTIVEKDAVFSEQAPKVAALDRLTLADGSLNITSAAKTINVQPKKMFDTLSQMKWIFRRAGGTGWIAYQDKIQSGYLEHKVTTVQRSDGTDKITEQVRVTPKGLAKLASLALN